MEKYVIGESDYSREQMEQNDCGWTLGNTREEFLETIKAFEDEGFEVKFETGFWRFLFGMGRYKVMAIKNGTSNN